MFAAGTFPPHVANRLLHSSETKYEYQEEQQDDQHQKAKKGAKPKVQETKDHAQATTPVETVTERKCRECAAKNDHSILPPGHAGH